MSERVSRDEIIRRAAVRLAIANPNSLPLPLRAKVEEQRLRAVLRRSRRPPVAVAGRSRPVMSGRLPNGWVAVDGGRRLMDPAYAERVLQRRDYVFAGGVVYA